MTQFPRSCHGVLHTQRISICSLLSTTSDSISHIHALDAFVQTLVFLFRSQFSQSWTACKRPWSPCALHHPQSAFCSHRKRCYRPSSFQWSGYEQSNKQHVAMGVVFITMAATMSCISIYINIMYKDKAEKTRKWTHERLFECIMHLLVGLPCSSIQPVQRGSTDVALELFILLPELHNCERSP